MRSLNYKVIKSNNKIKYLLKAYNKEILLIDRVINVIKYNIIKSNSLIYINGYKIRKHYYNNSKYNIFIVIIIIIRKI
jgi:hypothetical protein